VSGVRVPAPPPPHSAAPLPALAANDRLATVAHLIDHIQSLPPTAGGLVRGERIVIGLSGGADSIALTGLLHELAPLLELRIFVAHLDHGLRANSAEDREFCRRFCADRGIPFASARADVAGRARRTGEGVEAAGRRLRHRWLERVRRHYRADRIALGHHLDDHVETVVMWLGRGTGLAGLAGIEPAAGRFVRPLRGLRRSALVAECRRRGWDWREDPANSDRARVRNRIRHEVLPSLENALGSDGLERMAAMSRRAATERAALRHFADGFVNQTRIRRGPGFVEVAREPWRDAPEDIIFQGLRSLVGRLGCGGSHQRWNEARYRDVLGFIRRARTGQQFDLADGAILRVTRRGLLFLADPDASRGVPPAEFLLEERILTGPPAEINFRGRDRAYFDADRVRPPFTLRKVRPGDRMQPFGMPGQKKLSRLLAEKAVARHDRPDRLVVEDQDRIVWAVGLTTSESTRITEDTQRVLRLRLRTRPTDGKGPTG
jgi:tRNA(Ile)-lysidine synthase